MRAAGRQLRHLNIPIDVEMPVAGLAIWHVVQETEFTGSGPAVWPQESFDPSCRNHVRNRRSFYDEAAHRPLIAGRPFRQGRQPPRDRSVGSLRHQVASLGRIVEDHGSARVQQLPDDAAEGPPGVAAAVAGRDAYDQIGRLQRDARRVPDGSERAFDPGFSGGDRRPRPAALWIVSSCAGRPVSRWPEPTAVCGSSRSPAKRAARRRYSDAWPAPAACAGRRRGITARKAHDRTPLSRNGSPISSARPPRTIDSRLRTAPDPGCPYAHPAQRRRSRVRLPLGGWACSRWPGCACGHAGPGEHRP